jgi:hypothetical protein
MVTLFLVLDLDHHGGHRAALSTIAVPAVLRAPLLQVGTHRTGGRWFHAGPPEDDLADGQAVTDSSPFAPREHLAAVAAELNCRPRKTLGWETPAERLHKPLAA